VLAFSALSKVTLAPRITFFRSVPEAIKSSLGIASYGASLFRQQA
jgi:hypothetical protein